MPRRHDFLSKDVGVALIAPSVNPAYNPGIRVFEYTGLYVRFQWKKQVLTYHKPCLALPVGELGGELINYEQYYADIAKSVSSLVWQKEYDMKKAYSLGSLRV